MVAFFLTKESKLPARNKPNMQKKELLIKIGQRIREVRESKGIHQAELARMCERESSWMARIETGNINSSIYILYHIAKVLDVKLEELVKIEQ
jgi:putative transcriptional regulator